MFDKLIRYRPTEKIKLGIKLTMFFYCFCVAAFVFAVWWMVTNLPAVVAWVGIVFVILPFAYHLVFTTINSYERQHIQFEARQDHAELIGTIDWHAKNQEKAHAALKAEILEEVRFQMLQCTKRVSFGRSAGQSFKRRK